MMLFASIKIYRDSIWEFHGGSMEIFNFSDVARDLENLTTRLGLYGLSTIDVSSECPPFWLGCALFKNSFVGVDV